MKNVTHKWLMMLFISLIASSFVHSQNNALNFDGTDDYVDCGSLLPLSYTAEAWIYITDLSKANNIISGDGGSLHAFWAPTSSGTKLSAGHNGQFNEVEDPNPLVANTWYHVAVTYDAATTTMKLYKDGALVSYNTTVQPITNPSAHVYIGNFNAGLYVFAGNIDEVRIWGVAKTATDITNNSHTSFTTPQANLLANYRCNQGIANGNNTSITRLTDDSGNNNHGIFSGFTLTGTTSNFVGGSPAEPLNPLSVNYSAGTITCNGGSTSLIVTATGGKPPYVGIGTFTLKAGAFSYTVTDATGQKETVTGSISEPSAVALGTPSVSNVTCNKGNDGQIVVTASGGVGVKAYTLIPMVGTQSPTGTFKGLTANTYTLTATDANGCKATNTVVVNEPNGFDPDKCYTIINKKSGKVLDVFGAQRCNAARIIQYASNGQSNQKWRFVPLSTNGYVKIVAQHCGKVISNSALTNNSPVYQSRYTNRGHEDWKLECTGNGYFKITQRASGRVLDVQNASLANAAQIVIKDWNGSDNQQWQIIAVTCPTKRCDRDDEDDLLAQQVSSINGHAEVQRNVLGYTTNQGFRTDYLTVEKMNLLTNTFETLEINNLTENTDALQYQSFYDNAPDAGDNFYRIKQTYLNGDYVYSPVQMIQYKKGEVVGTYPNPATDEVWIDLKTYLGRDVSLVLSDLAGKTMHTQVAKASTTPYRLDLTPFETGLYLLKIEAQGKRVLMKKIQVTK